MKYQPSHPASKHIAEKGVTKYKVITIRDAVTVKSETLSDESGTIELVQKKRGKTLESRNRYATSYSIMQASKRIYRKKGISNYDLIIYKVDKGYSGFAYFTDKPTPQPTKPKARPKDTVRLLEQELQQVRGELLVAKKTIESLKDDIARLTKPANSQTKLMVVTDSSWGGVYSKFKNELGYYIDLAKNSIDSFTKRKVENK